MAEEKKSTAKLVYPPELSGSNTLERFDQGVYLNTFEKLAGSLQPKLRPMDYPRKIKGNQAVYYDEGAFDDLETPALISGSFVTLNYNHNAGNSGDSGKISRFTTIPSHRWVDLNFGQSDVYQDGTSYDDQVDNLSDPVRFLNQDPNTIVVPFSLVSPNDDENLDGTIEPLDTRLYISRTTEIPFHIRGVWAYIGTPDTYRRSVMIEQQYELVGSRYRSDGSVGGIEPFLDYQMNLASGSNVTDVSVYGYVHEDDATIEPFVDTTDGILTSLQVSGSADFIDLMVSRMLSGSNLPGADYLRKDHVSLSRGFDYDNSEFGFDSVAFGGLLK